MLQKINSFYVIIGVMFVTLLAVNNYFFKGSRSFLGVTYSNNYTINSEKAAIIESTHVVAGQNVKPGDLLVTLESPELTLEIAQLKKSIELLESEKEEQDKLLISKVALLEAQKDIIREDIKSDVELIQNQIELNRSLTGDILKARDIDISEDSLSSLQLQIRSIRQKGTLEIQTIDIEIADVEQDHVFDQSQRQSKIDLAQQELEWKLQEEKRLDKYATFSGVIEAVLVKPGEQVQAFTSLLSINSAHPSSVVGYLVGKKDRDKVLGQEVLVQSLEHSELKVPGRIIGFGSVVPLPSILQKSNDIIAFGVEVFIEIPEDNTLPVGEKIIVK